MDSPLYLNAVSRAVETLGEDFVITGSMLMVEKVPQDEIKTKSGIVLSAASGSNQVNGLTSNLPVFVHVLAIGAGYVNEDGSDSPLDTRPGDILLVGQHSVKWLPIFPIDDYKPYTIGVTSEAETQIRFRGIEAYRKYATALNAKP